MREVSGPAVIYEDDELIAIWSEGESDFAVITFSDLFSLARGMRFFADTPLAKAKISCLGIVAKRENWFPAPNVAAACAAAQPQLRRYVNRVIYGGSMGGYAAIKYSGLLQATEVLALCPQWSLDRAECRGVHPGWQRYFKPSMAGMGIRSRDVSGEIYLFVDRLHKRDNFHATMIRRNAHRCNIVNVPHVGHHVTRAFAGSENLTRLIGAAQRRDLMAMQIFSRFRRRGDKARIISIIDRAMGRKSKLAAAYVRALPDRRPDLFDLYRRHVLSVAECLYRHDGPAEAEAFAGEAAGRFDHADLQLNLMAFVAHLTGKKVVLTDPDDRRLVYDVSANRCRTVGAGQRSEPYAEVRMHRTGHLIRFFILVGGMRVDLTFDRTGQLGIGADGADAGEHAAVSVSAPQAGVLAFRHGDRFLGTDPNRGLVLRTAEIGDSERFRVRCMP